MQTIANANFQSKAYLRGHNQFHSLSLTVNIFSMISIFLKNKINAVALQCMSNSNKILKEIWKHTINGIATLWIVSVLLMKQYKRLTFRSTKLFSHARVSLTKFFKLIRNVMNSPRPKKSID